jgi:thioredoxin 1
VNDRFLHKINSSMPVVVDFYADWCVPCKQIPPVLKELKQELKSFRIVKVNVDINPFIAGQYNVRRLPTLMVFLNGKPVWTGEGLQSIGELKAILSRQAGKN